MKKSDVELTDAELKQRGYGNSRSLSAARLLANGATAKAAYAVVDWMKDNPVFWSGIEPSEIRLALHHVLESLDIQRPTE